VDHIINIGLICIGHYCSHPWRIAGKRVFALGTMLRSSWGDFRLHQRIRILTAQTQLAGVYPGRLFSQPQTRIQRPKRLAEAHSKEARQNWPAMAGPLWSTSAKRFRNLLTLNEIKLLRPALRWFPSKYGFEILAQRGGDYLQSPSLPRLTFPARRNNIARFLALLIRLS